jgi:hypothetical protein
VRCNSGMCRCVEVERVPDVLYVLVHVDVSAAYTFRYACSTVRRMLCSPMTYHIFRYFAGTPAVISSEKTGGTVTDIGDACLVFFKKMPATSTCLSMSLAHR